jgi:chromosome segregation ATPase
MTDPTGDLEQRVAALEAEVARLQGELDHTRQDAVAARVLATGADRDVSDVRSQLRAQRQLLQALRDTQVEHGARLDRLEHRMDQLEGRMTALEDRITGLDARLSGRIEQLDTRMDSLEAEMRRGFAEMRTGMAHIVTLLERDTDE